MKNTSVKLVMMCFAAIVVVILFLGCEKSSMTGSQDLKQISNVPSPQTTVICGQTQTQSLIAGQNITSGSVTISNDPTNLYITYTTINNWKLQKTHLYVGDCSLIPTTPTGNPKVGLFPYQTSYNPLVTSFTYTIPLAGLDSCYCVVAHAEVVQFDSLGNIINTQTGWGQGAPMGGQSWAMKMSYCTQFCSSTPTCVINPGDYRTQTQGGWGANPQGNNPASYLYTNFNTAFPTGLTVGCSNYTIKLSSPTAVNNFLPEGGTPASLTQSYVDPVNINNVLAGQVVALSLTVGFDAAFPNFCASTTPLSSLVITSGTFAGWTVAQVLAEGNKILGGCTSLYSASQINNAIDMINNNFDNGNVVGTYLTCP